VWRCGVLSFPALTLHSHGLATYDSMNYENDAGESLDLFFKSFFRT